MRQVLMQRGSHSFIRYCASESVFAGLRRIAKLATSIAIAAAFTGIALPTPSAQAQTATLAAGGQTSFAENETSSFTLTLNEFPTDLNPAIATVEVELRFLLTDPQFSAPTGTTYSGPLFDVIVTGNDGRVISTQTAPQASKRIRVSAAFNPNDSAAGVGQPAVITYTIHPNDITENAVFRVNRPGGKKIIFKDSSGNPITVPGFRQPSNNNLDFTITTVLAEDAVFVTYTYQNGDTIPGVKREEPTNTSVVGVDWNPAVGINLLAGATATYPDGTAYECDSSSSGNCQILFPSGRIANGGPVKATFPEESAPPAPTIPTPPPPVAEPGPELEIGKQVIPGTETAVVFNGAIPLPETRGDPGPLYRSIAETSAIVQAFDQSFGLLGAPTFTTAKCTYGLGGDALYGVDYYVLNSSDADIARQVDDEDPSTDPLRVVFNGPVDPNDPNDEGNPVADDSDNFLLIDEGCTPPSPVTWSIRLIGDNVVQGNKSIVFALREVQLFRGGTAPENALGVLAITQPDTLVLTVVDDEVSDIGQVVINTLTDNAAAVEGQPINFTIGQDRETSSTVFVNYVITGIAEADLDSVGGVINGEVGSEVNAGGTGVDAHTSSDDLRRGVIAISPNDGEPGTAAIFHITSADDDVPEGPETFTLTLSSRDNSVIFAEALRPNINEPGVGRSQAIITDNDDAPDITVSDFVGPPFDEGATLNFTFTLTNYTLSTDLHYRIAGIARTDLAESDPVRPADGSPTTVSASADPRSGTFQVTALTTRGGSEIIQGSIRLTARTDNILEGAEDFTFTVFAGDPANTNLVLSGGTNTITLNDATPAVTPTLTWPIGVDDIPTPGPTDFPFGGVLEGAAPHLLVDLGGTVVAKDTIFPISVGAGRRLDARVEPLYFEGSNAVRAAIIPAGSSRGTARVRIIADHISESAEVVTLTLGAPISGITAGIVTAPPIEATITINDRPDVEADAVTWRSITGQVNPGAGETHVADLTIRVDGGFTSDREAVDIYFDAESALGDVSWKRAGSENVLPVITRNHIAVSRFSFSPTSASDSTPTVTIGLYFTPISSIPTGQRVVVDLTRVDLINRSAGGGLAPIRARLCNDSDSVAAEACANHGFNAGEPRFVIAEEADASEVGPVNGGFKLTIAEAFRTPANGALTPTGTINYSVSGSARRGITRDYTLDITATNAAGDTNTTAAITTDTFGEVSIPFDNLDNIISFTVIPVADADGDEGTETVEITIDNIAFTGPDPVDIPGPQTLEINIADAPVATMGFTSSTYDLFRLETAEGGSNRRGENLSSGDDSRTNRIPSVRLVVEDIPSDAFYADISYQVDPASTATERSQAGGGATEDYTIARPSFVTGSFPDGTTGLGTSNTVTIDREHGAGQEIGDNNRLSSLDYWLNVIDDSTVEPPETVIMNFTATFFPCIGEVGGTLSRPVCAGGRGSQQIGPEIPFSFTFLINDNEAASAVRNQRLSPSGVVNEGGGVQAVFDGNERAQIDNNETFFYNITDASGGVITENNLGVTAADFRVTTNTNVGACGTPTAEQMAAGIICRGVYTATGSVSIQINLEIVDDELGENEEAFYVNLEPAMLTRGNTGNFPGTPANVEIAARTRLLVTIPDSDGGGPPPILGPTGRISTLGPVSIIRNDQTRTEVTVTAENMELATPGDASNTFVFFDVSITPDSGDDWTDSDFEVRTAETGSTVYVTTLDGSVGRFRANDGISTLFRFGGLDPGVNDDGSASISFWMHTDTDNGDGEETFTIALDRVYSCGPDVGGECPEPANILSDSDDGGATIAGSALTVNLNDPPDDKDVSVLATTATAVEENSLGLVTFTLSEASTAATTVTFTATGDGVRGLCTVVSSTGFCDGGFIPGNLNYALATRTVNAGTGAFEYAIIPTATTTITIPAGDTTYAMAVIPVFEAQRETDPDESAIITVMLPITNSAENIVVGDPAVATVAVHDPGRMSLAVPSVFNPVAIGGLYDYQLNLRDVGIPTDTNGVRDTATNNRPVLGSTDAEIDAVVELTFPANANLAVNGDNPALFEGDIYNVLMDNTDATTRYRITEPRDNVIRIVVPQARLVRTSNAVGNLAGAENLTFDVIGKAVASQFTFTINAYTTLASDGTTDGVVLDTLRQTISGTVNQISFLGATSAVLSAVPSPIPTEFDFDAPTKVTFTNPFTREITGANPAYTFSITPTDGGEAFDGEIEILVDRRADDLVNFPGDSATFTPVGDTNVVEFSAQSRAAGALPMFNAGDNSDDRVLDIFLKANVFSGDDRTFALALTNVRVEDSNANVIVVNGPPASAQSVPVTVPASRLPTAELRLTGPRSIETGGGDLGSTTFDIVLDNIPEVDGDGAPITDLSINLDFTGTTITDGTNPTGQGFAGIGGQGAQTDEFKVTNGITDGSNSGTFGVTFNFEVEFMDFTLGGSTTLPFTITTRDGTDGVIVVALSVNTPGADDGVIYFADATRANWNILSEAQTTNPDLADRTIAIGAAGTARAVSLSPTGSQNIANNNGPGADYTVSLTNIFDEINSTAVDSALMTLSAVGDFAAVGVDPKTIVLGTGETAFLLTLMPSALEGLEFSKPGSIAANQVQVSIPDDTAEFVIAVSATGTGAATESLEVTNVAYFDSSSTDLNGPRPHVIGDIQFASVDDPVVASLSSARRTIIGTGGGAQGMTEFFLTLTDLNDDDVVTVPLTLGNIGTISSTTATTVDGSNYDVVITGTSGVGSPDDAEFMTTGAASTVTFTADGDGDARIDFQITSEGNAAEPTISLGAISIGTRNIVTQTASLAYQIVSATTVPSISVSNTSAFPIDFATDTLTVDEGGADPKTFQIKPSHLTAYIEMLNPGVDVATGHIDVTLRATDLTFNQANGKTITLGNAAATLTIASGLVGHEFVNDTAGSSTAILRISGVQTSTITFTGGFVDEDMDFTLAPTAVAYFDSSGDPLDGPAPRFTGGRFSVDAEDASASIATDQTTIVVGDVGGGEVVITLANLPLGGFKLNDDSFHAVESLSLQVSFGEDNGDFEFGGGSLSEDESARLAITGISNAEDYDIAYAGANVLSMVIPRSRLLASTGDNPEAQGFEEITINFTAKTTTVNPYAVGVLGNLIGDSTALAPVVDGETAIAFNPAAVTFTVAAQGTATLNAFAVSSAPDGVDTTANEEGTIAGGWVLRLRNVAVPTENVVVNYTIPALTVVNDIPDAIPGTDYDYTLTADDNDGFGGSPGTVTITQPEVDPEDGSYTGTITIGVDAYGTPVNGLTGVRVDIFVNPVDDDIVEGVEDVRLRISEVPGATYTASDPVIQNVRIADNNTATVAIGVNNELVDQGDDPVAGVREGFTYPVQLFIKEGNYTSGLDTELLSETNNILLAEDATFTLEFAAGTTGSADITGDNSDVFFSDSTGGTPSETATVTIPAGESTGLAYITIRSESAVDGVERFKIDITESDTVPFQPVYAGRSAALRADVTIRNTSGDIRIRHEADAGFCAGRTPAVRNVIIPLLSIAGVTDCATAATSETADATAFDAALAAITTLDLSGVSPDLTSLQPGDFAGLTRLTTLGLNSNNIRVLPATVFDPLVALTSLTLAGNELTNSYDSIPENVFDNLAALTTLNLGNMSTLTGLPDNVLDDVLNTLTTLTLDDAAQRFVTFAEPNEYEVTQSGETTVRLRITNSAGETATTPTAMFVTLNTTGGTGLNPPDTLPDLNSVDRDGIIIPAGSSGVDVVITADDNAVNTVAGTPATLGFINVTSQTFLGTYNDPTFTPSLLQSDMLISVTANSATPAPDPVTASVDIVAPVVMTARETTPAPAEFNNSPGVIDMTLNRIATDVGTADVTFTLAGATLATGGSGTVADPFVPANADYLLDITRPDGTPVQAGGDGINDTDFSPAATGGTFRLAEGDNGATFTITPIADGFPSSEGTETVTIAITEVDYSDGTLHTAFTIAAAIDIADNTTAPTVGVVAKAPEEGDTQITENDGDDQRGTFTITLTNPPAGVATVTYALELSDEDAPAVDFDAIDQIRTVGLGGEVPAAPGGGTFTMTVADGETTATGDLAFTAARDSDQVGESVTLTVSRVTFADIGTGTDITAPTAPGNTATISIVDDDPLDALQVDASDAEAVDGIAAETGTFTFSGIELPVGAVVAFTLDANSTAALTAVYGTDYTLSAGTHTLSANASGGRITTTAVVDEATGFTVTVTPTATADTDTTDDTVILTITGATVSASDSTAILVSGTDNSATITIREAGTMSMAEGVTAATEASNGAGTFVIELRDVGVAGDLAIPYTVSGTAGAPADDSADSAAAEDYDITVTSMAAGNEEASITGRSAAGGTINLTAAAISDTTNGGGAGAATITVTITPLDGDNRIEATETVILSLTAPAGFDYSQVDADARTVEIADNSTNLLQYNLVNTSITVAEPATGSTTFSDASTYTALRFSPVTDNQDIIVERPVTVQVRSESGSADDVDDDGPPDFTKFTRNMTLNGSTGTPITVTTAAPITQSVSFDVLADDAVEPLQFFRIRARDGEPPVDDTAVSTGVDEATISITDAASPLTVAVRTTQVAEGDGDTGSTDRQIEVAFSAPDGTIMQREASVSLTTDDGTALAPGDYTAIGTAVTVVLAGNPTFGAEGFLLGKVSGSNPTVAIAGDADDEDNETFLINLSGTAALFATNGITAENTITIIDNDGAAVPVINPGLEYEAIAPGGLVHLENLAYSDISGSVIVPAGTTPDSAVTHFVYVSNTGLVGEDPPLNCNDATIAANTEIPIAELGDCPGSPTGGFTGFAPDGATITFRLRNAVGLSSEGTMTIREAAATVTSVELKAYDAATGGNDVTASPFVPIAEGSTVYQRLEANAALGTGETLNANASMLMPSEDAGDVNAVAADLTSNTGFAYSLVAPAQNSASHSLVTLDDNIVEGPEFFQIVTDDINYNQASVAVTPAFGGLPYQSGGRLIYRIDDNDSATATVHVGSVAGTTGTDDPDNSVEEGASVQAWVTVDKVLAVEATFTLDLAFAGGGDATDVTLPTPATVIIPAMMLSSLNHQDRPTITLNIPANSGVESGETFTVGIATEVYGEGRQSGIEGIVDESGRTASITIMEAPNICGRTPAVRNAIRDEVRRLARDNTIVCGDIMNDNAHLDDITTLSVSTGLTTLPVSGDFAGLSGLQSLSLTDGTFSGGSLTAGIFTGLDNTLTTLNMSRASGTGGSGLTVISDAAFDSLTGLTTLNLEGNTIGSISDDTIFTPLTALRTLRLARNATLTLEDGALDVVLDGLDILTWPIAPSIASFPTNTSITVEQGQTEPVPVQLDSALPVAVSIPITVTFPGDRVSTTTEAIFPAGDTAVNAIITADSNASTTATSGTLAIGTPRLLIGGDSPGAPGTDIANVDDSRVRSALIVRDSATASVNVIAVTGPTARLSGSNTSLGLGGTANFSLVLSNIDDITDPAFTHVEVVVELGGTGIAGDIALVSGDVDSVETSDYRIDITSGNVVTTPATPAVDTDRAQGDDPAALIFYVPAAQFDAGDDDAVGAETINFTLTIKDDAGFSLTTTPNTLIPSLSLASGNPSILAVDASQNTVSNGDITVLNPTLTYTITAPFTVSPASAEIDEGERAEIILTLTNAASGPVTIPYSVGGDATVMTDYTIDPTGDSTATAFVIPNGESRASIFVTAVSDRVVDADDKTVTISLTTGAYPGGGADMFTGSGALVSTVNIDNTDTAPTGVTVTANPERINETGSPTQSTITVRLNQPALFNMAVELDYTLTGGTAIFGTTCSAPTDYTAAMGGTTLTATTGESLTFAAGTPSSAGETEKTITVTACEDEVDESNDPDETVIFTILAAGATNLTLTADVSTTIAIREITVVPQDVMDQVETVATVVATEHVSALTTLIRQRFSVTSSFGSPPRVPTGTVPAPSTTTNLALADNPENMNDMINSMGLERTAQGDSNNQYAVWIRGQRSAFEGTPEIRGLTVDYDGSSTGIGMGAEYSSGGYLAGLAMNYVTTEVDISSDSEGETVSKYEESMVIVAPYFSLKAGEGTSLWASFGVGTGTADATLATQTKSTDAKLSFLNAGADFTVIGRSFEIVTGLSGLAIRKVVDSFTFTDPEHVLPKTTIDTMQAVGEVTIYRPIPIAGQIVRPYLGISTVHDFGDIVADDDHGLGIRSGVTFGVGRISADIELSSELLRENRRQWTVSGGARFATRPGGQGLSLSLDGTQETQMDAGESVDDDAAQTWGIGLEGGYGMPVGLFHPNGLLTPFASIDQTGDGRDMSGGARLSVGNGLSLDLETTRQMHDDSEDASEHKAGLRGQWSF